MNGMCQVFGTVPLQAAGQAFFRNDRKQMQMTLKQQLIQTLSVSPPSLDLDLISQTARR